jgi:hypothetical protein
MKAKVSGMGITEGAVTPDVTAAAADPWLSVLSSALDGSPAVDPLAMVRAQLEAQGDPRAQLLLRILDRQQHEREARERELEADVQAEPSAAPPEDAPPELIEDVRNVQEAVDALYEERDRLAARVAALAAAIGACRVCFGEDAMCERCLGHGVSGWRRPEPLAFRRYILPAYQRARAIERARAGRPLPRSDGPAPSARTTTTPDER